jgi:type VI secretion system protein ImpH
VPDAQSKFHVRIGPLRLAQYQKFLPGEESFMALVDWVRNYLGIEYAWDVRLVLHRDDVPAVSLGGMAQLGWTSWMLDGPGQQDADDLGIDPELWLKQRGHQLRASRRVLEASARR